MMAPVTLHGLDTFVNSSLHLDPNVVVTFQSVIVNSDSLPHFYIVFLTQNAMVYHQNFL
jgi:hypothetical protein